MSMYVAFAGPVDGMNRLTMVVLDSFKGVQALRIADLPDVVPTEAPGMCYAESKVHIFVPANKDSGFQVQEVTFDPTDNSFSYVGVVPGVSTNDRVTALYNHDTTTFHLFYQDSGAIKYATRVGTGQWNVTPVSGAGTCLWGPAACYRGGDVNLAYCNDRNELKVGYLQNGTWAGISPSSGIQIWRSPALTNYQDPLVGAHGRIFATFVWNNTWNINYVRNAESSGWTNSAEINSYNCADGGPTTCLYNNNLYMFSQGRNNSLLCTIYALQSWPDDNPNSGANYITMRHDGNDIGPVYWAPVAVAPN